MAIYSVSPQILGQPVTGYVYKYINDPFLVSIESSDGLPIPIEVKTYDLITQNLISKETAFEAETDGYNTIRLDYMKIIRNYVSSDFTRVGKTSDISNQNIVLGLYGIQPKDSTLEVKIIALNGASTFKQLTSILTIPVNTPLEEFTLNGIVPPKFIGMPYVTVKLKDPAINQNLKPDIQIIHPSTGYEPCGLFVMWRSRLGGWAGYDFKIFQEDINSVYQDNLNVEFDAYRGSGFIAPDYTGLISQSSITARALRVPKQEVLGLEGLRVSPAIFVYRNGVLELHRLTSFTSQMNNLSLGSEVSISLTSIHTMNQITR